MNGMNRSCLFADTDQRVAFLRQVSVVASKLVYLFPSQRLRTVFDFLYDEQLSDNDTAVYVQEQTSASERCTVVVAFRGTVMKDLRALDDLLSDVALIAGGLHKTSRFQSILERFLQIRRKYRHCRLVLTGHSLGGTLAFEISRLMHKARDPAWYRTFVFNAGSRPYGRHTLSEKFRSDGRLEVNLVQGDIISTRSVEYSSNVNIIAPQGPFRAHRLQHFLEPHYRLVFAELFQ